MKARPSCFSPDRQEVALAFSRALANTGKSIAARIAIMAMTTSSSIRVKADRVLGAAFACNDGRFICSSFRAREGVRRGQFDKPVYAEYYTTAFPLLSFLLKIM